MDEDHRTTSSMERESRRRTAEPPRARRSSQSRLMHPEDVEDVLEMAVSEAARHSRRAEMKTASALDAITRWIEQTEARRADESRRLAAGQEKTFATVRDALDLMTGRLDDIERKVESSRGAGFEPIRSALGRLEERIDSLERESAETGPRSERLQATLGELESRLGEVVGKIDELGETRRSADDPERERRISRIESKLGDILSQLAGSAARPAARPAAAPPGERVRVSVRDLLNGASVEEAAADILDRQSEIDEGPRAAASRQMSRAAEDAVVALHRDVAALVGRLGQIERTGGETACAGLREEIDALSRSVGDLPSRRDLAAIERTVREIAQTAQAAGSRLPSQVVDAIDALSADVRTALARNVGKDAQAGVAEAIAALAARLERLEARNPDPATIDGLARGVDEIRSLVSNNASLTWISDLGRDLGEVSRRLDAMASVDVDARALTSLARAVTDVRATLQSADFSKPLARIEERLEAFSSRLDDALREPLGQVGQHIAALSGRFDQIVREPLGQMGERLAALSDRVEAGSGAAVDARFDEIRDRLDRLTAHLEGPGVRAPSDVESMLRSITTRLDDMRVEGSTAGLGEIEGQLEALHARFDAYPAGQADIEGLQRAVGDLVGEMRGAREAAVTAAREAAREFIAATGGSAPATDLSEIRQRQEVSDRRVQMTLEAVNTALERIVDRLGALEAGIATVPASSPSLPPAPSQAPPAPELASRLVVDEPAGEDSIAAPQRVAPPQAETPRPPAEPVRGAGREAAAAQERLLLDELIEPGAGRPDPTVRLNRETADLAAAPAAGDPMSVIAAARRARMVATSGDAGRTGPAEGRVDRLASGKALASGVGAVLATHRRSLLIGVAGLIMVLGLVKIVSGVIGSRPEGVPQASITAAPTAAPAEKPVSAPASVAPPAAAPDAPPAAARPAAPERQGPPPASGVKPDGDWEDLLAPSRQEGSRRTSQAPAGFAPATGAVSAEPAPLVTGSIPREAAPALPAGPIVHSDIPKPFAGLALGERARRAEPAAMLELGIRLGEGRGVARDVEAAARWFDRAAEKGFAPAQFRLASAYEKGIGVKRDLAAAKTWYGRAAEAGNARAMHNLAVLVAEGVDGKPDYAEASRWFVRAAELGVRDSQYNLGILAARGLGLPQDLDASYRWFAIAAAGGDQDAGTKRDEVGRRLTPAARQRADAMVKAFRPREAIAAANDLPVPAGGWDAAVGTSGTGAKVKTTRL